MSGIQWFTKTNVALRLVYVENKLYMKKPILIIIVEKTRTNVVRLLVRVRALVHSPNWKKKLVESSTKIIFNNDVHRYLKLHLSLSKTTFKTSSLPQLFHRKFIAISVCYDIKVVAMVKFGYWLTYLLLSKTTFIIINNDL